PRIIEASRRLPEGTAFGLHVHAASSRIGFRAWENAVVWCVEQGQRMEHGGSRPVECLDLGGGWFSDDWSSELVPFLPELVEMAKKALPCLREIILEPGKALVQSAMAVVSRVLEVRTTPGDVREAVVDASIAELPEARMYPHPVLWRRQPSGPWRPLERGVDTLLGRLCIEQDVLATDIALPHETLPGDLVAIGEAGAYDASMAYTFGEGRTL
ncbi:MAG: hypothetical protein M3198_17125, partial [Actinomycetota bacterium]|nr:hypothetical protein [Actinomycetota bacterium]